MSKKQIKEKDIKIDETVMENKDNNIELDLSLDDHEEGRASDFQKEILKEEMDAFAPINNGEVNVSGVYAYDMGSYIEVKVFIRNGLNKTINMDKVPFIIVNSKNEVLAYQLFDMKGLGNIPPHSARPWKLNFDKKNLKVDKIPMDDWKIAFDNKLEAMSYADIEYENIPGSVDVDSKLTLDNFLKTLPRLEKGQVSFSKFSMGMKADGDFLVTLVVRNATDKVVNLNELPVTITDDKGNVVLSANFTVADFNVKPNKAQILNLSYKTETNLDEDIDLSNWNIEYKL